MSALIALERRAGPFGFHAAARCPDPFTEESRSVSDSSALKQPTRCLGSVDRRGAGCAAAERAHAPAGRPAPAHAVEVGGPVPSMSRRLSHSVPWPKSLTSSRRTWWVFPRGVADHGLDVDVGVAVGQVGITQTVVVLRLRRRAVPGGYCGR